MKVEKFSYIYCMVLFQQLLPDGEEIPETTTYNVEITVTDSEDNPIEGATVTYGE